MADRPILFSAPMVRALLDGRKTQTRRVLTDQPPEPATFEAWDIGPCGAFAHMWHHLDDEGVEVHSARLPAWRGDHLWVREAWSAVEAYDDLKPSEMSGEEAVRYGADGYMERWGWPPCGRRWGRYRHARFMPRWASRLTLTVTDVRVQRLQEISEADALAEGMTFPHGMHYGLDPQDAFRGLWTSLHGPDAWDANPWVAAISFEVHRCNIDQMPAPSRAADGDAAGATRPAGGGTLGRAG